VTAEESDIIPPISNSELQVWTECHRKWYLSHYRELGVKRAETPLAGPLIMGTAVHYALERLYEHGEDPLEVLEELYSKTVHDLLVREAERGFPDQDLRKKMQNEREMAHAMLEGYVAWVQETGADEGLSLAGAEVTVEVASGIPGVRLRGKLDQRIYRDVDGARLFRDFKPQPLTEPVLTPSGWRKLGELVVGDYVIGEDGTPRLVLDVYDRGVDDVYDVQLNDGVIVRATADHPWWAKDTVYGQWKIVQTSNLKPKRHRLASFTPVMDQSDVSLPVDPYVLGMWITNGVHDGRGMCDGVKTTMQYVANVLDLKVTSHTRSDKPGSFPIFNVMLHGKLTNTLDELNLLGRHSVYRFIPKQYIYAASYAQRLALLHGLMDGDGTLSQNHASVYSTGSRRLADDVGDLVRSLGGWARVSTRTKLNHVGAMLNGYDTDVYQSWVAIRTTFNPFLLIEHANRWQRNRDKVAANVGGGQGKHGTPPPERIVRAIMPSGRELVRCIRIDGPSSLYVTRDWVVTHNTAASLAEGPRMLPLDEQMKYYMLLERLDAIAKTGSEPPEPTMGGLYTMLKKNKHTARAKPPFYQTVEVQHNRLELESMWMRTHKRIREILEARTELDAGGDQRYWVAPRPNRDCTWKCQFFAVCPIMDEAPPETWNAMLGEYYEHNDPYERYEAPSEL